MKVCRLEGVVVEDLFTGERMLRHRQCVTEREVIKGDIPEWRIPKRRADRICTECGRAIRPLEGWEY